VKTTCEPLEGNKVKLSILVDEADFATDIDAAFAKIAQEVRLPGFRAGKAPRKVLEARIGIAAAREQALRDAVPQYLGRAVREHNVDIIATPEIDIVGGQESGPVSFDATCEIRPVITLPGYGGLRVEVPAIDVADQEVDDVLDTERRRLGKLTTIERAAKDGDFVVVDLVGSRDGEPVVGLAVDDWSYEIGKKWVAPSFDDELIGKSAGASFTFSDTPSGTQEAADFAVTVNSVQELVVADLDDAWVNENIDGFTTVAEWRESVVERLTTNRLNQVRNVVVEKVTDALVALAEIETPEAMVAADLQRRVENTIRQFQSQGINIDQWMQATGQDAQSFVEGLRPQSQKAVKVDLALRAVVKAESLDATEDEIEREFESMADRTNEQAVREHQMAGSPKNKKIRFISVDQVRAAYQANDAVVDLAAEISKSKALDWLIHRVEYVDPSGKTLDSDVVIGHSEADHNHDHDHDHSDHDHSEHDHSEHDHAEND
jgi:trigger factor